MGILQRIRVLTRVTFEDNFDLEYQIKMFLFPYRTLKICCHDLEDMKHPLVVLRGRTKG